MSGGTIRSATPGDADALEALAAEFHVAHGDPTGLLTADAIRRDGFGAVPEFAVMVAQDASGLLRYALFYDAYEPSYAARGVYIADLYVRPVARRRGLGRRLIAAVARDGRDRGRRYLWWVARAENTASSSALALASTLAASRSGTPWAARIWPITSLRKRLTYRSRISASSLV